MDSKGRGSTSDAATGIEYAVQRGIRIVNGSFGSSSKSSALEDAVDYAQSKGVLIVVAAGNDGDDIDSAPIYPASYSNSNILSVAASTEDDTLASFSNFGSDGVDVAAPGDNIRSTYLGSTYKNLDGTSMASPYVAGAAALLKAVNSDATYSDLRTALRKKVDKPSALNGKVVYDGRLNIQKALDYIRSLDR
jgi:subtilisin family serine protease